MLMPNIKDDDMKKTILTLMCVIFCLAGISACNGDSNAGSSSDETTVIQLEYPVYGSAEELVDASDLVFSGTVTHINYDSLNVQSQSGVDSDTGLTESSDIPYTIFDIDIHHIYKGNVESESIEIKRPGGVVNGQVYAVEGASDIELGETYLFITQTYQNTYPSLLNVTQASFDMSESEVNNLQSHAGISLSEVLDYLNSID